MVSLICCETYDNAAVLFPHEALNNRTGPVASYTRRMTIFKAKDSWKLSYAPKDGRVV